MPSVDVVIVNWNGRRCLSACLESLHAQTEADFEVWLVDNGSTDGSVAWVQERHPVTHIIVNQTNRGFAAANKQAIRAGQAPYVATLNNDTFADPCWLAELARAGRKPAPGHGGCADGVCRSPRAQWAGGLACALRMRRKRRHLVRRRSAAQIMSRLAPVQPPQQVVAGYRHLAAR